jgi:hypothetical protein
MKKKRLFLGNHPSLDNNMEESMIPSLSTGVVGSRFVTQDEVETAKARRDEQWKAAYARLTLRSHCFIVAENYPLHRLGQEPPPQQQEDSYDGRSLAEVSMLKVSFKLLVFTFCSWSQRPA